MHLSERTTVPTSSVEVEIRPCVRGKSVIQPAGTPKQRIGTAELRLVLHEALSRRSGTQQRVVGLKRQPSIYSTSFAIEELDVRLQDDTSLRLRLM
jgi:hypothetical protein